VAFNKPCDNKAGNEKNTPVFNAFLLDYSFVVISCKWLVAAKDLLQVWVAPIPKLSDNEAFVIVLSVRLVAGKLDTISLNFS